MREAKLKKSTVKVSKSTKFKLDVINRWQIRGSATISLCAHERRDPRPGHHKKWSAANVLRVCFKPRLPRDAIFICSTAQRAIRRRIAHSEKKAKRASLGSAHKPLESATVLAQSRQTLADQKGASSAHIGHLRNAVARAIVNLRDAYVAQLEPADTCVLQVAFDETEMRLGIRSTTAGVTRVSRKVRSVMMLHVVMSWIVGGSAQVVQLGMVPVILARTTAANLFTALWIRLACVLLKISGKVRSVVVISMTDSGRACKRTFRLLEQHLYVGGARCYFIMALCVMHLLFLCINACHKPYDCLAPMFCGTALIHRGQIFDTFVREIERQLERRVEITLDPPSERLRKYSEAVHALLTWEANWAGWLGPQCIRKTSKNFISAAAEFKQLFTHLGERNTPKIRHYCPMGCCPGGRKETVRRMMACLLTIWCGTVPAIPALNRWTKFWSPLLFWTLVSVRR